MSRYDEEYVDTDDEAVEISCELVHETDAAVLINDGDQEVWIPLSKVSDRGYGDDGMYYVMIPEWLANQKGLI